MPEITDPKVIQEIYKDTEACAKLVGLIYSSDQIPGFTRRKRGKGFEFLDDTSKPLTRATLKKRLAQLVIPPAWKNVWISPDENGHIQVTGVDERGRKQYIYNPKWRTMRDLLKFYKLIMFSRQLVKIRKTINEHLDRGGLGKQRVLAVMLWVLDNTYIRVGNDIYFAENDSIGLTTLTDRNVVVAGPVVTFAFKGKSGKDQQLTIEHPVIADVVKACRDIKGAYSNTLTTQGLIIVLTRTTSIATCRRLPVNRLRLRISVPGAGH